MSSVARVTEISAMSESSFQDAIQVGVQRAAATLRGLKSAWVKEQEVQLGANGQITAYKVNLLITFELEG
jgi:dodecin